MRRCAIALHVGKEDEHPAVAGLRAAIDLDPEYTFHLGMLLDSLDALEDIVLDIQQRAVSDPDLKGRIKVVLNRSAPGTRAVDERLDASPVYGNVTRCAYGKNGVQAFFETDILSSGPTGESMVLELDYVFPGYDTHVFSVVELG